MSADNKTIENARAILISVLKSTTPREQVDFYNTWAENYDTDMASVEYNLPTAATKSISSHFKGDRETAVVLDVACGTGLVAKQLTAHGFKHFVGIDGSKGMLEVAKQTGLYKELKQCLLGEDPLPVELGLFDVVAIVGSLIVGHIPIHVFRELCNFAKPGGYVCITTRDNCDSSEVTATLVHELKQMEEEGMMTSVEVAEEKKWHMVLSEQGHGYESGVVHLYKKL